MNDEAVGECDEPCRNLDARDAIAEEVKIITYRERGGSEAIRFSVSRSASHEGRTLS